MGLNVNTKLNSGYQGVENNVTLFSVQALGPGMGTKWLAIFTVVASTNQLQATNHSPDCLC